MAHTLKEVFPPEEVRTRTARVGSAVAAWSAGRPLLAVCVLKGAFLFFADLVRDLASRGVEVEVDFVRLASYGSATSRGLEQVFSKDLEADIKGRHVLLVEDIVDTGRSADFLLRTLAARGPAGLALAALVDKRGRREVEVAVDFAGFALEKGFLVGFGMDYAEMYRGLCGIHELVER